MVCASFWDAGSQTDEDRIRSPSQIADTMSFDIRELLLELPLELCSLCFSSVDGPDGRVVYLGSSDGTVLSYQLLDDTDIQGEDPILFRNGWKSPAKSKIEQMVCPKWDNGSIWILQGV